MKKTKIIKSEINLETLVKGQEIKIEVCGKKYQLFDKHISIIGRAIKNKDEFIKNEIKADDDDDVNNPPNEDNDDFDVYEDENEDKSEKTEKSDAEEESEEDNDTNKSEEELEDEYVSEGGEDLLDDFDDGEYLKDD